MPAPTIAATTTADTSGVTSYTFTLPAGTGDKLFVLALDGDQTSSFTITSSGWTILTATDSLGPGGEVAGMVAYKPNTSDTTVSFQWTANERGAVYGARIAGSNFSTRPPELAFARNNTATAPDPPNLDPTWASVDTLVLAVACVDDGTKTVTAYPYASNNVQRNTTTANGALVGVCSTTSTGGAVNPGAFTVSANDQWVAFNIAIGEVIATQNITPAATTVTATPGSMTVTFTQAISLTGSLVTISSSLTVDASTDIFPIPVSVAATGAINVANVADQGITFTAATVTALVDGRYDDTYIDLYTDGPVVSLRLITPIAVVITVNSGDIYGDIYGDLYGVDLTVTRQTRPSWTHFDVDARETVGTEAGAYA